MRVYGFVNRDGGARLRYYLGERGWTGYLGKEVSPRLHEVSNPDSDRYAPRHSRLHINLERYERRKDVYQASNWTTKLDVLVTLKNPKK